MDRHVKTLGTLNMIFGAAGLLIPILTLVVAGGFSGLYGSFNEDVYGFLAVVSVVFHMVMAIPCFLGGLFVRRLADWARVFMIVVSAVNILNAPLGTMLGAYGLWVLLLPETEPLFDNAQKTVRRKPLAQAARAAQKNDGSEGSQASVVPSTPK